MEARYLELESLLASYGNISDKQQYNNYARELALLKEPVSLFREQKRLAQEIAGLELVLAEKHDQEFIELARKELEELREKNAALEEKLESSLAGEDKELKRDIIVEVRQGTGGDEAALFAEDLYRMYTLYAAGKGWAAEMLSSSPRELGGFKEVTFSVKGKDAYKRLRFESGVHRVQRVPATEAQGRIHTSMRILRAKLLDAKRQEESKRLSQARKSQIGSGDRSEKIRTYNFPDRRITDHRINFTSHRLEAVLEGGLDELSDALIKAAQEKRNE